MGSCASKVNEPDGEVLPPETAADMAPKPAVEAEAKTENAEESKEQPLVDLSEPTAETSSAPGQELASELKELQTEAPVEEKEETEKVEGAEKAEEEAKVAVEDHPLKGQMPEN